MKSKYFQLFSFVFIFLSYSCTDTLEEDTPTAIDPEPITPDLAIKISTSVSGFAIDEAGEPVRYASVVVGDKQSTTDVYGYFHLSNASVPKFAGQVKIMKTGYFEGYKTFHPQENKEAFVRLQLLPRTTSGNVEATTGGTTSTADGAQVTLPANGVVTSATTSPYTGTVSVNSRVIHPSTDKVLSENPGDARGINRDGHAQALTIISTVAVEITGSNGEALQLAEGKTATIKLPIPTDRLADAPQTIALWSFDTATGLWKQEGSAIKTGNVYEGSVPHFSFWAGAEGIPMVNFTARIVNTAGEPLSHIPVSVTIAGMPKNAGHGRFGYTDANGYVTGAVFANKTLVLDILTPCALSAYEHEFSTTSVDTDLGILIGNLGQNVITLSGTVLNCEDEPVASGYVQTYDNGFYNRIAVVNGTFTFTGLVCTNTEVNLVAVDYETYEQNEPQSVAINPGVNALGALSACGTPTLGHITYTISGTTVTIQEPTDTIAAYLATPQNTWTQVVTLSGEPNTNQQMSFQFSGGAQTGTDHAVTDVFSSAFPSGRGYWPVPITVTIAEYGEKGGFIRGSFSGNLMDFEDNTVYPFSCSFKVRRQN